MLGGGRPVRVVKGAFKSAGSTTLVVLRLKIDPFMYVLYTCVCMYVYIYIYIFPCGYRVYVYVYMYMYMYMYIPLSMIYLHTYIYIYIYMYDMYVYIYICGYLNRHAFLGVVRPRSVAFRVAC